MWSSAYSEWSKLWARIYVQRAWDGLDLGHDLGLIASFFINLNYHEIRQHITKTKTIAWVMGVLWEILDPPQN